MPEFLPPAVLEIMSKFDDTGIAKAMAAMKELDAMKATAKVKIDVEGRAELTALKAQIATLRDKSVKIKVNTERSGVDGGAGMPSIPGGDSGAAQIEQIGSSAASAGSRMSVMYYALAAVAGVLPMIGPLAAVAAAGVVALGSAAAAAGAGLGTMLLGFTGPVKAVQLMGQASKAAAGSSSDATSKMYRQASAAEALAASERSLVSVQRDAARVQDDLTAAREAARRSIEDMNLDLADGDRAQRQASLNVRKALEEVRRVRGDSSASRTEREQSRLTYEQAQADLSRLGVTQGRLATDTADANRRGVEGSDQVRTAQERILDTQDRLIAATVAVAAAHRQVEQAAIETGAAGSAAMNQLGDALAKLSPEGRRFAYFLRGLIDGPLAELQRTAEAGLLPGVQRGVESLLPYFPQLNEFVGKLAKVLGDLFEAGLKALANPEWRAFFKYMGDTAGPALTGIAKILGNVAEGFASLIVAFAPTTKQMGEGLVGLTRKFADWAAGLSKSESFNKFIDYVKENGPKLVEIVGNLVTGFINFMKNTSGSGSKMLDFVVALTRLMDTFSQSPIGAKIMYGSLDTILPILTALINGLNSLLQAGSGMWETLRGAGQAAWGILSPIFEGIKNAALMVGGAFVTLWTTFIKPLWDNTMVIFQVGWTFLQIIFGLWTMAFNAIGQVFRALYDNFIAPIWNNFIKPIFQAIGTFLFDNVVPRVRSAVDTIGRIWHGIIDLLRTPLRVAVNFINDNLIEGYNKLARKVGGPKIDPINIRGFATGGVVPGVDRGYDSVLAMLRPQEGILIPEATRALGGAAGIGAINAAARSGSLGPQLFGPVGNGAPSSIIVENHVHLMLDGQELVGGLTVSAQQTKFRSGVSGMS